MTQAMSNQVASHIKLSSGNERENPKPGSPIPIPNKPNTPAKPDKNPDPTKPRPGGNEPEKNDPTRIDEPLKTDPTRIAEGLLPNLNH